MARQEITFKQGSLETGDSGERGNNTTAGGGATSIKPYTDGELVRASTFNRSVENMRKRTEVLRSQGEEDLYRIDAGVRYCITGGNASGAVGLTPSVQNWQEDEAGPPSRWTFETTQPLVVQPLNTASGDLQEVLSYTFTDPITSSIQLSNSKRSYQGANRTEINWVAVDPSSLGSYNCIARASGDPKHILTISVRNDGQTTVTEVCDALDLIIVDLIYMGISGPILTGTGVSLVDLTDWDTSNPDLEYTLSKTVEREVHYIIPATFASFFSTNHGLADGETLAIHFDSVEARRSQHISNTNPDPTTVTSSMLFITTDNPERIPACIPLCKKVGTVLYWLDGTVVIDDTPVVFGENGYTVSRVVSGGILYSPYAPSPVLSSDMVAISGTPTIQAQMEDVVDQINRRASLATNESIQSARWGMVSVAPIAGASSTYRFGITSQLGERGAYVEAYFHNFESILTSDVSVSVQRAVAGYFKVDVSNATVAREASALQAVTYTNANVTSYVRALSNYLGVSGVSSTDVYALYSVLNMSEDSSLVGTCGSAYFGLQLLEESATTSTATINGLYVDADIRVPTSAALVATLRGKTHLTQTFNGAFLSYHTGTVVGSLGTQITGTRQDLSLTSGAAVSTVNGLDSRMSINSITATGTVQGIYNYISISGAASVTADLYGSNTYLAASGASTAVNHILGAQIIIANDIALQTNNASIVGGLYIRVETTPLSSYVSEGTYNRAGAYIAKGQLVLSAGAGEAFSNVRGYSCAISAESSATALLSNDVIIFDGSMATVSSSTLNLDGNDMIGLRLDLGSNHSNVLRKIPLYCSCEGVNGSNVLLNGPQYIFEYSSGQSLSSQRLVFKREGASGAVAPSSCYLGGVEWWDRSATGPDDTDWEHSAAITAQKIGTAGANSNVTLNLSTSYGQIILSQGGRGGLKMTEDTGYAGGGSLVDMTQSTAVVLPYSSTPGSWSTVPLGAAYLTIGGSTIDLNIWDGSAWRTVTLS